MNVAHIIPPMWEGYFPRRGYLMCLAQWILQYPNYVSALGQFSGHLLMDNGAFEGALVPIQGLVEASRRVGADEVALPDVLGDAQMTLSISWEALSHVKTAGVMFIPQGQSQVEWKSCADAWMAKWQKADWPFELTIGLTALRGAEGTLLRKQMVHYLEVKYDVPIHLLGLASVIDFAKSLETYQRANVRGIDTSLAFALGHGRRLLTPTATKVPLGLPSKYVCMNRREHVLSYLNMLILDWWVAVGQVDLNIPLPLFRKAAIWGGATSREVMSSPQVALRKCSVPAGGYAVKGIMVRPCAPGLHCSDEIYLEVSA